jgi:hypothetical protein
MSFICSYIELSMLPVSDGREDGAEAPRVPDPVITVAAIGALVITMGLAVVLGF